MKELLARLAPYGKYAGIVGYPLFYLFCLALFASFTFPYDKLRDRLVASFAADQRASGGHQELQIDALSGYGLTGVRMTGVTLLSAPAEPGKPPARLVVDEATVRYGLLSLLFGGADVDFDVMAFGGEARGEYGSRGKDKAIDVALESLDLGKIGPLVQLLGVPLDGKAGGTLHLSMPEGKITRASGDLSFESKGTAVGDGKAKLKGALALPKIDVGTLTIAAEAKDGVLKLTKFIAAGKDLDVQGDGRVTLRENVTDSLCDLQVRFRVNDAYRAKNDVTKSLFGAPGSTAPPLFDLMDPKIKQAKRADGFYGWSARGAVSRLEFFPSAH
ncbi:MAG TPA: type II secretion system protein GspN [Polyangiaceae bacterium]|nr:type II secretion system protein GspN [Polyangiaceae bacterium]